MILNRPARIFTVFGLFCSAFVYGQNGRILKYPGLQKLNIFLGTWKSQTNPGSQEQDSAIYSCQWSLNGKFLICDQKVSNQGKQSNNLAIYDYDSVKDSYTLSIVGIPGVGPFDMPVKSIKDTLIYSGQYSDNGETVYTRTLNIFITSSKYIYLVQTSKDSLKWSNVLEGTATRIHF